jgi:hypothetical protein
VLEAASIIARGVAFAVACFSFYLAFFLYEDEKGLMQNRLESLWISIYERAKATDSLSTALFNKIGATLRWTFSTVFGASLFSIEAFLASTNLSLAITAGMITLLSNVVLRRQANLLDSLSCLPAGSLH